MPQRHLPAELASVAEPGADARLSAPSALRNAGPITALLRAHAPAEGRALEIASGTGQHVLAFARAFPGLTWQPTEIAAERRASIDAWAATEGLPNIRAAIALDATAPGWANEHGGQDLVVLVNLLHLISTQEARTIIAEVARALAPGGRFVLYGPFLRDGEATSEGDASFDASLRASDPDVGYKDDFTTIDWLHEAGLTLVDVVEMPANNLAFVAHRAPET